MIRKVKSISMWLWHHLTPQIFAVICVFIITIIALFMPPYIGMADNGDFSESSRVTVCLSIIRIMMRCNLDTL